MSHEEKCEVKKNLGYPLDRQGTLHIDGEIHSTGLFDKNAKLYVSDLQYKSEIPEGVDIVLLADDGERIELGSIEECPDGDAHHHFTLE